LLVALFVVGVVYTVIIHRLLIRGLRDLDEEREELEEIMQDQVEKLERVVEKIYPAYESPTYRILSASYVIVIESDATIQETKRQEIEIDSDAPLHFTNTWIEADEHAPAKTHFRDIDFAARDLSGHDLCYLPITNRPRKKRAVLFFLPRASKEDGPRTFETSYCWPKAMSGLLTRGKDQWWRQFDRPVESLKFEFKIANVLNPKDVEYTSMPYQDDHFHKIEEVKGRYTEYVFTIENVSQEREDRRYRFNIITEER
jgi:hypothetical protein